MPPLFRFGIRQIVINQLYHLLILKHHLKPRAMSEAWLRAVRQELRLPAVLRPGVRY